MHYIKLGPIRVPYEIRQQGQRKVFFCCGLSLPFTTETVQGKKKYRLFGIPVPVRVDETVFVSQSRDNYLRRDTLTPETVRSIAQGIFREKLGYEPDLDNPKTLNEKIFWLKLYCRDPRITRCCDKFAVKGYVEEVLGPGYTVPTLKSWHRPEDVDFDSLPRQYVLKVNWASGYNILVRPGTVLDREAARRQIARWMAPQANSYYSAFNWGYRDMKPVVYAEEYLEQRQGQLYDYKFFCMNGVCRYMLIATDRQRELTFDFFDRDFSWLDIRQGGRRNASPRPEQPRFFREMMAAAEKLAAPFPFVRVDFYEVGDRFYVGEMTFYPGGGVLPYDPPEWDRKLGDLLNLEHQRRDDHAQ